MNKELMELNAKFFKADINVVIGLYWTTMRINGQRPYEIIMKMFR